MEKKMLFQPFDFTRWNRSWGIWRFKICETPKKGSDEKVARIDSNGKIISGRCLIETILEIEISLVLKNFKKVLGWNFFFRRRNNEKIGSGREESRSNGTTFFVAKLPRYRRDLIKPNNSCDCWDDPRTWMEKERKKECVCECLEREKERDKRKWTALT